MPRDVNPRHSQKVAAGKSSEFIIVKTRQTDQDSHLGAAPHVSRLSMRMSMRIPSRRTPQGYRKYLEHALFIDGRDHQEHRRIAVLTNSRAARLLHKDPRDFGATVKRLYLSGQAGGGGAALAACVRRGEADYPATVQRHAHGYRPAAVWQRVGQCNRSLRGWCALCCGLAPQPGCTREAARVTRPENGACFEPEVL